jgi:NADPH:quinone reductase-like Zn-dependent oxidoreductase
MRAAVVEGYGGVERLQVKELEPPGEPGTGEVLVRVRASSVNPLDSKIRTGQLRFVSPAKFPLIPGFDLAGEVEAVGPEVTRFAPGDSVFGQTGARHGGACARRRCRRRCGEGAGEGARRSRKKKCASLPAASPAAAFKPLHAVLPRKSPPVAS